MMFFYLLLTYLYLIVMKSQEIALTKIHQTVQGMRNQVRKIIRSNHHLPSISPSNFTNPQVLVPQTKVNSQIKLMLQETQNRYSKIMRSARKNETSPRGAKLNEIDLSYFLSRKSTLSKEPMFFNRAGKYDSSQLLSRYQNDLVDGGNVKMTRRSKRELYNKKMINLLPEILPKGGKQEIKTSKVIDLSPGSRYHATINVDSNLAKRYEDQGSKKRVLKTIEPDLNFIEKELNRKKRRRIVRSKCRINAMKSVQLDGQKYEDQPCQPWQANHEEADDLLL